MDQSLFEFPGLSGLASAMAQLDRPIALIDIHGRFLHTNAAFLTLFPVPDKTSLLLEYTEDDPHLAAWLRQASGESSRRLCITTFGKRYDARLSRIELGGTRIFMLHGLMQTCGALSVSIST